MWTENIKSYRKFKGWTQEKMAVEFGLSRDNIASYERGIAKPTLEFACKICDDISVSLHDFLYGEILNPVVEAKRSDRVQELEDELQKAYKTITQLTQRNISYEEILKKNAYPLSELTVTKVAEDGPEKK